MLQIVTPACSQTVVRSINEVAVISSIFKPVTKNSCSANTSTILIFCEKCWKKFVVPLFCELQLLFLFHFWQHLREFVLVILTRSIN